MTMLKFDEFDIFSFEFGFQVSAGLVIVWLVMFGGILARVVANSQEKGETGAVSRHIQMRYFLYRQMAAVPGCYEMFSFLSDA
jgi:hypothetical protein